MSDTKKIPRPRCAWCGNKIKGKLRQASKNRRGYFCNEGCGPKTRGRTRR